MMRLGTGLVRIPDVSFISWDRMPGRQIPARPIPDLVPDLAVEVLSEGNTDKEMERKRGEFFRAGVRLAWFIDPVDRTAVVYTAPGQSTAIGPEGAARRRRGVARFRPAAARAVRQDGSARAGAADRRRSGGGRGRAWGTGIGRGRRRGSPG
jgi:hypothetical protein